MIDILVLQIHPDVEGNAVILCYSVSAAAFVFH